MKIGDAIVDFELKSTEGTTIATRDFADARALVVIFSCNHCPYVQAYEGRMIELQADYKDRGVRLVAINSNDAAGYPEDSFPEMARRAREKGFNFPYLHDESQRVARAYGATHTPQIFAFGPDRRLAYAGKLDDNWQEPARVKTRHLRDALDDILAGRAPRAPETHAIGCTIKWRR